MFSFLRPGLCFVYIAVKNRLEGKVVVWVQSRVSMVVVTSLRVSSYASTEPSLPRQTPAETPLPPAAPAASQPPARLRPSPRSPWDQAGC